MAMTASAVNMYVIGENVNGKSWVLSDESSKMSEIIPGVYQWRGQVLGSGFKFNNGDWIDPDLNIGSDGSRLMLGSEYRYITGPTSGNICYAFDSEVINPVVTLNLNDKTVLVEGQTTGNSQNIVFISWDNAINGSPDIILTSNNITLKASQGLASNPPVINSTSKDLRIYARGQLSLSSQLLMTKVVFPLSAQGLRRLSEMEVSEGKLTYDLNNKVVIWSGQSHNFRPMGQNGG